MGVLEHFKAGISSEILWSCCKPKILLLCICRVPPRSSPDGLVMTFMKLKLHYPNLYKKNDGYISPIQVFWDVKQHLLAWQLSWFSLSPFYPLHSSLLQAFWSQHLHFAVGESQWGHHCNLCNILWLLQVLFYGSCWSTSAFWIYKSNSSPRLG